MRLQLTDGNGNKDSIQNERHSETTIPKTEGLQLPQSFTQRDPLREAIEYQSCHQYSNDFYINDAYMVENNQYFNRSCNFNGQLSNQLRKSSYDTSME